MEETKKHFDYLGNEIKENMIIQHIQTKSSFSKMWGSSNPENVVNIPEQQWKVICEYKIRFHGDYNMLFADLMNCDVVISQSLDMLLEKIDLDRNCIAIKGVSEKEQNYIL
jgi:hypothetical protein